MAANQSGGSRSPTGSDLARSATLKTRLADLQAGDPGTRDSTYDLADLPEMDGGNDEWLIKPADMARPVRMSQFKANLEAEADKAGILRLSMMSEPGGTRGGNDENDQEVLDWLRGDDDEDDADLSLATGAASSSATGIATPNGGGRPQLGPRLTPGSSAFFHPISQELMPTEDELNARNGPNGGGGVAHRNKTDSIRFSHMLAGKLVDDVADTTLDLRPLSITDMKVEIEFMEHRGKPRDPSNRRAVVYGADSSSHLDTLAESDDGQSVGESMASADHRPRRMMRHATSTEHFDHLVRTATAKDMLTPIPASPTKTASETAGPSGRSRADSASSGSVAMSKPAAGNSELDMMNHLLASTRSQSRHRSEQSLDDPAAAAPGTRTSPSLFSSTSERRGRRSSIASDFSDQSARSSATVPGRSSRRQASAGTSVSRSPSRSTVRSNQSSASGGYAVSESAYAAYQSLPVPPLIPFVDPDLEPVPIHRVPTPHAAPPPSPQPSHDSVFTAHSFGTIPRGGGGDSGSDGMLGPPMMQPMPVPMQMGRTEPPGVPLPPTPSTPGFSTAGTGIGGPSPITPHFPRRPTTPAHFGPRATTGSLRSPTALARPRTPASGSVGSGIPAPGGSGIPRPGTPSGMSVASARSASRSGLRPTSPAPPRSPFHRSPVPTSPVPMPPAPPQQTGYTDAHYSSMSAPPARNFSTSSFGSHSSAGSVATSPSRFTPTRGRGQSSEMPPPRPSTTTPGRGRSQSSVPSAASRARSQPTKGPPAYAAPTPMPAGHHTFSGLAPPTASARPGARSPGPLGSGIARPATAAPTFGGGGGSGIPTPGMARPRTPAASSVASGYTRSRSPVYGGGSTWNHTTAPAGYGRGAGYQAPGATVAQEDVFETF
ncbi:hypothetical protein AMAG_05406 [Allomyces macrogynus ATCC 38327]|uniref:Uncharacterized protein n=1 Tax=Allomyces macrogynus (strain ATCC 38327) TaxID=578462 RepID=A0A0L0SC15_ALLM3|nr:hypothetical protein AMAG_05406 [Allomyces macrogynus ATCC 38327]|eukprot:KNE59962.1 hypothetical protein AMAG_05406 [Allomyces macrogynus ATCC 38327]